jgi:hypothetical protein
METVDIATIVSVLNVLFLVSLMYIYLANYLKMKTRFGLGLLIFGAMLMLQNLAALYCQLNMVMYYTAEVASVALVLNSLECVGLAALVYISWK